MKGTKRQDELGRGKVPSFLGFVLGLIWIKNNWKGHWKLILVGFVTTLSLLIFPIVWKQIDPFKKELTISPNIDAPTVTVNVPTTMNELIRNNILLDRDEREFNNTLDFYSWLSKKPKLKIQSSIIVDDIHDFISASEITLEQKGKIISKNGSPIHLLTLSFVNNGGIIISEPLVGIDNPAIPLKAKKGTTYNRNCHDESCNKRAFANGGSGEPGESGTVGGTGGSGGKLILAAVFITSPFDISLIGGKGGKGGVGGEGGNGGDGKGGSRGDGKLFNCKCGGRNGGSGGNAGIGGKGGPGGKGGNGGSVLIVTTKKYSANSKFNLGGGEFGDGGRPGKPGMPGKKGEGCRADLVCSKTHSGANGQIPSPPNLGLGDKGATGATGHKEEKLLQLKSNQPNYDGFYSWVINWNI